ncbi:uncharacterized protein LOC144875424 [Branchiostoma floridae x Branchiostoma japonicum]
MLPLGQSLAGRLCSSLASASKRSLVTCQVLSSSIPSSSQNCSFFKNRQVSAQSAPLVNTVSRRHRWKDVNGHPSSILPFITTGTAKVSHLALWEDACAVDNMKAHLATLSAAARPPCTVAVRPELPQDSLDGQLDANAGPSDAAEQDDATYRQETAKSNEIFKHPHQRTARSCCSGSGNCMIAHSYYGEGTPWSRQEENRLLLNHIPDLTTSETDLKERVRAIFKTLDYRLTARMMRAKTVMKMLNRVRRSRRIILRPLSAMESWERRGACEYEREKRLTYVTLRLEHEADVMGGKKKQRLKNFRSFLSRGG